MLRPVLLLFCRCGSLLRPQKSSLRLHCYLLLLWLLPSSLHLQRYLRYGWIPLHLPGTWLLYRLHFLPRILLLCSNRSFLLLLSYPHRKLRLLQLLPVLQSFRRPLCGRYDSLLRLRWHPSQRLPLLLPGLLLPAALPDRRFLRPYRALHKLFLLLLHRHDNDSYMHHTSDRNPGCWLPDAEPFRFRLLPVQSVQILPDLHLRRSYTSSLVCKSCGYLLQPLRLVRTLRMQQYLRLLCQEFHPDVRYKAYQFQLHRRLPMYG